MKHHLVGLCAVNEQLYLFLVNDQTYVHPLIQWRTESRQIGVFAGSLVTSQMNI